MLANGIICIDGEIFPVYICVSTKLNDHSFFPEEIMFDRMRDEFKTVSGRLRDAQDQITVQADELLLQARHKAHLARDEGAERIWHLENQALDWVEEVLDRADMPGVDKVREPVAKFVGQARDTVTSNPISGYAQLNARAAAGAIRELTAVELLRVERIEQAGKGRKTVFEAIERRRVVLQRPPFRDVAEA